MRVEERESLKTSTRNILDSTLLPEAVLLSRTRELLRKLNSLGGQSLHPVLGLCLKLGHLHTLFSQWLLLFRVSSNQFNKCLLHVGIRKKDFENEMRNWHVDVFLLHGDETSRTAIGAPLQSGRSSRMLWAPPLLSLPRAEPS